MTGKRIKYSTIILAVVASGVTLLAGTQPWFVLGVSGILTGAEVELTVSGAVAAPALSALAFAGLAMAAALAIAGPIIRIVLGVLGIVVGGSIVLASALAIGDPIAAGASVVATATGVSGPESIRALVLSVSVTAWPAVAVAAGILLVLAAIAALVTARAWPASSRRYQAVRLEPAGTDAAAAGTSASSTSAAPDPVDEWDELSRGDDPTA